MNDQLQARTLMDAAFRDLKALTGMSDSDLFEDEIFGSHVQQAVEKSLKAWLAHLGKIYPYSHNLVLLTQMLEEEKCDVSAYKNLTVFSSFAAKIRYVGLEDDDFVINRQSVTAQVQGLYNYVNDLLN